MNAKPNPLSSSSLQSIQSHQMVASITAEQYNKDYTLLRDTIGSIHGSVERMERALIGDPAFGYRGLVERMDTVEKNLSHHTTKLASTPPPPVCRHSDPSSSLSSDPFPKKKAVRRLSTWLAAAFTTGGLAEFIRTHWSK